MYPKLLKRRIANLSLQSLLTIPFLLQIFIIVGLVGYFSFRNGQQAVNEVATKLRNEVTSSVQQHLQNYLEKPCLIVELNQKAALLEQLSFDDWQKIEIDFWRQFQIFDSVYAIYLADPSGKFAYVKKEGNNTFIAKPVKTVPQRQAYLLDEKGQRSKFLVSDRYDPRGRPWYISTITKQTNNWSEIYTFSGGELGITIAGELYDSRNNFRGVVGVDLVLRRISDFLETIKISDRGQVFILERNGYLVATSTTEEPFTYNATNKREERLKGTNSKNPFTQATANYLIDHFGSLDSIQASQQLDFKLEQDRQLVQVLPYGKELGLDWLIVLVVPEADFMTNIHRNNRNTILLCLGALAIATSVGVVTSRKIAQPITNLSKVSTIIAQSARDNNRGTDFYPIVKTKNIKELEILADSFNEMVVQLRTAFRKLEKNNEQLEIRVQQRTAALMAAKKAADAANLAKSEFLAHMSHELRTPLHAILGFTQISLKELSLNPQQRKNLITVKRSGEHLLTLIDDVLEMSKIESGKVVVTPQLFDFHLLLANLAKMFELPCQEKNLQLIFSISPHIPQYVKTDLVKLRQILTNLLENSIKFTQQGKINLKVSAKPNTLYLEIEDTGCGIAPSELDTIFDAFVKTKHCSDRNKGTGLGLAITQQFVHLLGGEISVSSVLNQGSIFKIQLPVIFIDQMNRVPLMTPQQSLKQISASTSVKNKILSVSNTQQLKLATQIDSTSLEVMPREWIDQLQKAAIEIDADSIKYLLQKIPPQYSSLKEALSNMLEKFEYDEIIQLTESVNS